MQGNDFVNGQTAHKGHNLNLYDRERFCVTGVSSVESFDEETVVMELDGGSTLTVEGVNLNITELDLEKGCVEASGLVTGMFYSESSPVKRGFFSRLVKG